MEGTSESGTRCVWETEEEKEKKNGDVGTGRQATSRLTTQKCTTRALLAWSFTRSGLIAHFRLEGYV